MAIRVRDELGKAFAVELGTTECYSTEWNYGFFESWGKCFVSFL